VNEQSANSKQGSQDQKMRCNMLLLIVAFQFTDHILFLLHRSNPCRRFLLSIRSFPRESYNISPFAL
jgi:hypothetical protein